MYLKIIFLTVTVCAVNAVPSSRTELGDAIDKTSMKFLNKAYEQAADKNVIASPLGVMLLLSLYSGGAGEQSKQQINELFKDGEFEATPEMRSNLNKELTEQDPSYFTDANKIYVSDSYTLNEQFSRVAKTYDSEVETINFKDQAAAENTINQWAEEKTRGNIKKAVSPGSLDQGSAMALFNVLFFQGHWNVPFNKNRTVEKDFHVDENTVVKKPTMRLNRKLNYTECPDLKAKMLELPYKEAGFSMIVVLPNGMNGLPEVLSLAKESGLLTNIMKLAPAKGKIILEMPKFEVKTSLDLNKLLPELGVSAIFHEPASGIVNESGVVVSKAFQEAFIKVDEEGATAGAATGSSIMPASMPKLIPFKMDHPFLYVILYEDNVVFAGTFTH